MNESLDELLDSRYFHVFKRGAVTIIGFEGKHLADRTSLDACRDSLFALVDRQLCQILVVDLSEVGIVSSWILGVLASVQQRGIEVHLYHPSSEVEGVLRVTKLDELMNVRDDLSHPTRAANQAPKR
jgi:anti-anti-sigma factor